MRSRNSKFRPTRYSAEFGRSGGAVVNAIIKSGTNRYHGSLFEFFRNSALDARDYFEPPARKKASYKQNQFGGTFGGPIVKDKLFVFGDYQGTSIRNPLTLVSPGATACGTDRAISPIHRNRTSTTPRPACRSQAM